MGQRHGAVGSKAKVEVGLGAEVTYPLPVMLQLLSDPPMRGSSLSPQ